MTQSRIRAPRVYAAIAAITAELAGIGIAKSQVNVEEGFSFRGIDDVLKGLAPLLAKHRLCILPRVLERTACERQGENTALVVSVCLKVAFDIVCARDGSVHTIETYAEALDRGDKATAKAMSSAYKHAMLHAFCIPVEGTEDADFTTHRLIARTEQPDPVQGWDQWSADITDLVQSCETGEAITRVQETYRDLLRIVSRRQPELYAAIGKAITRRREALAGPSQSARITEPGNGGPAKEAASHA